MNMNCGICLQPISIFYYKGKCDCNVRYHYECVISWYRYNKICIFCKKNDCINLRFLEYRYNKLLTTILILFFSSLFIIFCVIRYIDYYKF